MYNTKSDLPEQTRAAVIELLNARIAAYTKSTRRAIDQTDGLGDKATTDLFTEISRGADKLSLASRGAPWVAQYGNVILDVGPRVLIAEA